MIKGVIFDYGGTIDSRGDHWSEIIWDGYRHAGVEVSKEDFRDAYVYAERALAKYPYIRPHHDFLDLLRIKMRLELDELAARGLFPAKKVHEVAEQVASYCYDYARKCVSEARPVLEEIRRRGIPMVLVSNFYGNISSVLADFGLDIFFPTIIESAVVGVRKPDPAIFGLGVDAIGLPASEVLVVGDSLRKDILPARSLGCQTAWIKGKGWTAEEDAQTDPCVIKSLSEVLDLL